MANLTIVSTSDRIDVDFGDLADITGIVKGSFRRSAIDEIYLKNGYVQIIMDNNDKWIISIDGNNSTLIVDTIDTLTPSSISDLYDKIKALIKI